VNALDLGADAEAGPVRDYRTSVPAEWIDENDHMDTIYYKVVANDGTRALFRRVGLTPDLMASNGSTFFQAEMHICFERELRLGDPVSVHSWLVAADAKRIHHIHEIFHEAEGYRAATVELMTLHISRATRRTAPMPVDLLARLQAMATAHARLPLPDKVGHAISAARRV